MTQQLRDELARLAEQAPTVRSASDVWARGRRARRLDRVLAGAAALVVVVALAGIATAFAGGPSRIAPASPGGATPGIPDTLYAVPRQVQLQDNSERFTGPLSPTLAVGQAAVAFVTGNGLPVVVDAETGAYHLLDLPGWRLGDVVTRMSLDPSDSQPLALSPDGRQLAWAYAELGGRTSEAPARTGVRVVDLESGTITGARLTGIAGRRNHDAVLVKEVAWSPNGRWVAWSGLPVQWWNASGLGGFGDRLVGTVDPDRSGSSLTSTTSVQSVESGLAVSDLGTVLVAGQGGTIWRAAGPGQEESGPFSVEQTLNPAPTGAYSPDDSLVAVGSPVPTDRFDLLDLDGRRLVSRPLPPDVYPDGAIVRPLGWVDEETILVVARTEGEDDLGSEHLAVMSAPTVPRDRWTYRVVARSEPADDASGVASYYSVAVDLMTRDRLTVARPAPDWPWSTERRVAVATVSVVVVVALGTVVLRRRRRSGPDGGVT